MATAFERWEQTLAELAKNKAKPEDVEKARVALRQKVVEKARQENHDNSSVALALSRFDNGTRALAYRSGLVKEPDVLTEDERFGVNHPVLGGIKQAAKELVSTQAQGWQNIAGSALRLANDFGKNEKGTWLDQAATSMEDAQKSTDEFAGEGYATADGVRGFGKMGLQNAPILISTYLTGGAAAGATSLAGRAAGLAKTAQEAAKVAKAARYAGAAGAAAAGFSGEYGDARQQTLDKFKDITPEQMRESEKYAARFKAREKELYLAGAAPEDAAKQAYEETVDALSETDANIVGVVNSMIEFVAPGASKFFLGGGKLSSKSLANAKKFANFDDVKDVLKQFGQEFLQEGFTSAVTDDTRAKAVNGGVNWGQVGKDALVGGTLGAITGGGVQFATGESTRQRALEEIKAQEQQQGQDVQLEQAAQNRKAELDAIRQQRPLTPEEQDDADVADAIISRGAPQGQPVQEPQPQPGTPVDTSTQPPVEQPPAQPAPGLSGVVQRHTQSAAPSLDAAFSDAIQTGQSPDFTGLAQQTGIDRNSLVDQFNAKRTDHVRKQRLMDLAEQGDLNALRSAASEITVDPQQQDQLIEEAVAGNEQRKADALAASQQQVAQAQQQAQQSAQQQADKDKYDQTYSKMLDEAVAALEGGQTEVKAFLPIKKKYSASGLNATDVNGVIEHAKQVIAEKQQKAARHEQAVTEAMPHLQSGDEASAVLAMEQAGVTDDADVQSVLKEANKRIRQDSKKPAGTQSVPAGQQAAPVDPLSAAVAEVKAAQAAGKKVNLATIAKKHGVTIMDVAKGVVAKPEQAAPKAKPSQPLALPAPQGSATTGDVMVSRNGKVMSQAEADALDAVASTEKKQMRRDMADEAGNPTGIPTGMKPKVEKPARTEQKAVLPNLILRTDGKPFPDTKQANRVLASKKLADTHEVVSVDGGKAIALKSAKSGLVVKNPATGSEVGVDSIEDAARKFSRMIAETGADPAGGMDVFDASTGQPVANVKADGTWKAVETREQARERSERAVAMLNEEQARKKAVTAKNQVDPEKDDILAAIAKLGGVNWDQARKQGGFDPAESGRRGSGILRVFKKNGGMTLDGMAEHLSQYGYPVTDENGDYTVNALLDAMDTALRGGQVGTAQFNERLAREMHEQEAEWRSLDDAFDGKSSGSVPAWLDDGADALVESVIDGEAQPSAVMADALNEVENEREIASPAAGTGQKADAGTEARGGQGRDAQAAGPREGGQQEGQGGAGQDPGVQAGLAGNWIGADRFFETIATEEYGPAPRGEAIGFIKSSPAGTTALETVVRPSGKRVHFLLLSGGSGEYAQDFASPEKTIGSIVASLQKDIDGRKKRFDEQQRKLNDAQANEKAVAERNNYQPGVNLGDITPNTGKMLRASRIVVDNGDGTFDVEGTAGNKTARISGMSASSIERAVKRAKGQDDFSLLGQSEAERMAEEQRQAADLEAKRKEEESKAASQQAKDATTDTAESKPEPVREMTEEGRAKDGKPIIGGDKFRTSSGRETTPYPHQKSEKYASQWLIDNATAEAEARGDDFNAPIFRRTTLRKNGTLTDADRDSMLMYLFGEQPKVVPSILKPLTEGGSKDRGSTAQHKFTELSELSGRSVGAISDAYNAKAEEDGKDAAELSIDQEILRLKLEKARKDTPANKKFDSLIATAADSPAKLQEHGIERVLDNAESRTELVRLRDYLTSLRPDKAEFIADAANDIGGDKGFDMSGVAPKPNKKQKANDQQKGEGESPQVSPNKVFTEDAAEKARALLKKRMRGGQLNSGIDPEIMQAGITLAGYHIEKGARTFAAYAKSMMEDLGSMVRPYLKSWYMGVRYDPRASGFTGMSSAAEVDAFDINTLEETDDAQHTGISTEGSEQEREAPGGKGVVLSEQRGTEPGDGFKAVEIPASEVFGKEKQREAQKQAENKPPREQLMDEVADAIRSAEDSGLKETASRLHNLTQDLHARIDTPENGRKRLETILHDMKNPILSGEWVSLGKGRTVFRWEGMDYGRIEDTRITEDRSSSVSDPWKTSDGQTHATLRDAKRHELAANSRQRLIRDGYMTDESSADQSKAEESAKPGTITDFGEKIGGARKDVWQSYEKSLSDELPDDASEIKLSKHFPEPDYDAAMAAGVPEESLAAVKAMRDEIPAKPQKSWKVKQWADKVRVLREFAADIMSGKVSVDNIKQKMREEGRLMDGFANRIELYKEVGYPRFTRMQGKNIEHAVFNMFKGETRPGGIPKYVLSEAGKGDRYYDTRQQALDALKGILDSELNAGATARTTKLDIYRVTSTGDIIIGKKVAAGKYIDLKTGFNSPREAHEYLAAHQDELMAELERKKETKPERKAVNDPRQGEDYRKGEDVTPEKFSNTFGFRGVEFGNYVEGARRQQDLNNAYDALLDLATILNVPPKALSLNGSLGLAFGARGSGGKGAAAAHFEPSKVVINLTKGNGAGSLAHEWFHALDNYFSRARGQETGHISDSPHPKMVAGADRKLVEDTRVRKEVLDAWKGVMDAIRKSGMVERSKQLDTRKSKDYWSTPHELTARAFEKYIIDRAAEKQASNDYLANVLPEEFFDKEDPTPYPTNNEAVKINAAYQKLFDTMKHEVTDKGVKLYSTADTSGPGLTTSRAREILSADPVLSKAMPFIDIRNSKEGVPEGAEPMYLPAYHGSPFKFDKFSLDHMGKGEGNQAYGWGLYFSGAKAVAEYYRKALSEAPDNIVMFNGVDYDYSEGSPDAPAFVSALSDHFGVSRLAATGAIVELRKHRNITVAYGKLEYTENRTKLQNEILKLLILLRNNLVGKARGQVYRVELPEDGTYLSWDKPLSEQSKYVSDRLSDKKTVKAFGKYAIRNKGLIDAIGSGELEGWQAYESLVIAMGSQEKASKFLNSIGISGIKFLDGASRSKGEGSYNYVVFDDSAIRILETYYSAGKSGGPEGYYHNGRITLFADNIRATGSMSAEERLKWVAFHEITHRGVANLAESQAYLSELERAGKNPYVKNLAKKIYDARQLLDEKYHVSMEEATEEALAEINAALRTGNVKQIKEQYGLHFPLSIRPRAKSAVARFFEAVKRIFNRMFGRGLTDAQVENLLRRTNDAGMTPNGGPGRGKDYDATVFSLADNGDGSPTEAALAEARRQLEEQLAIADRMIAERGGLFAPNGQPSKLNRRQWAQVRTANFKSWFGDWETDPANASKVVDENGEPLVVYHGTKSDISIFDGDRLGFATGAASAKRGFFFASDPETAGFYAENIAISPELDKAMGLHNEANVAADELDRMEASGTYSEEELDAQYEKLNAARAAYRMEYDSVMDRHGHEGTARDLKHGANVMPVFLSAKNVEIRDQHGHERREETFDSVIRWAVVDGKDGVVIKNTFDPTPTDVFVVFDNNQIKSATGNAGTFSGKTDDIRYSAPPTPGQSPGRSVFVSVAKQWMFQKWAETLGTQLNTAMLEPLFKPTYDLVQRYLQHISNDAYDAISVAPNLLGRLEDINDYGREIKNIGKFKKINADRDAAAVPLFEGTRFDKKVYSDAVLKRVYNLTDDQVAVYREARAAIEASLDSHAKSVITKILLDAGAVEFSDIDTLVNRDLPADDYMEELRQRLDADILAANDAIAIQKTALSAAGVTAQDKASIQASIKKGYRRVELLEEAAKRIDSTEDTLSQLKREGYFPLMRWGKYTVTVKDAGGNVVDFRMVETLTESEKLEAALTQQYHGQGMTVEKGSMSENRYKNFAGISPETLALFAKEWGVDNDEAYQEYLKLALPGQSALKRRIHRKGDNGEGIAGFSTDIQRTLAAFVMGNARHSARNIYGSAITQAVEAIPKNKGTPYDIAFSLAEFVTNPDENSASVSIRNMLFIWNMGASVAFGALNLTQPWMMTLPWLSQFSGIGSVVELMGKAAKTAAIAQKNGTVPQEYYAEYQQAVREGHVDPQNVFMLQGIERGGSGLGSSLLKTVSHGMGMIAAATESYNRKLTLFAALDVARAKGLPWLKSKGFDSAYAFAVQAVAETQGVYNKGNRPAWARGPIGAVLLVFKQYAVNWIEMAVRMGRNHYGDDRMRKGLMMMLGLLFAMAGGMGMPFAEDLKDIAETAMGSAGKPVNIERQMQMTLGKGVADAVLAGPINAMVFNSLGLDMHGRMSMGNLIPGTGALNPYTSTDAKLSEGISVMGAGTGLLKKGSDAVAAAQDGRFLDAAQSAAPRAVESIMKGVRMMVEGKARDARGNVLMETTPWDAAAKMIDFQPASVAITQRERGRRFQDKNIQMVARKSLRDRLITAYEEKDAEKIRDAEQALDEWNQDNPLYQIKLKKRDLRKAAKKRGSSWLKREETPKGLEWTDEYADQENGQ